MSVRKSTRTLLAGLVATSLAPAALATSPYDLPFGLQWSFMTGGGGNDNPSDLDVTADGTVWVHDIANNSDAWGHGGATGSLRGSIGAINPAGGLVFATSQGSLPGMQDTNQSYSGGVSAVGNTAYFATHATRAWWDLSYKGGDNQGGTDRDRVGVYSLDASGVNSISNENTLTYWADNGLSIARTDSGLPNLPGGGLDSTSGVNGQNRVNDSAVQDSTLKMVLGGDGVGEFARSGDWGGAGLNGGNNSYQPQIGVYDFNTNTLDGPTFHPVVSGGSSQHADYFHVDIDQTSGHYFGGGISHARGSSTSTQWDPDGAGGAAGTIAFVNSFTSATTAGIGTAYDASNNFLYSVTWDNPGVDILNTIAATNDGDGSAFWGGEFNDQSYVEKRDSTGAVVWSDTLDMGDDTSATAIERVVEVTVDDDGNLWVTGYADQTGGDSSTRDTYVRKYNKTGANAYTEAWTRWVNFGANKGDGTTETVVDAAHLGDKAYTLVSTSSAFDNTTGATNAGSADILVNKLVPGDFNGDGIVDFNDMTIAETSVAGGPLVGNDTYDFDRDGDSTKADVLYFIGNILDRRIGDIDTTNFENVDNTTVDNSDLSIATGNFNGSAGSGQTYLGGDLDLDGDVDNQDLGKLIGNFGTGNAPADNGNRGYLLYDSASGEVTLDAFFAGGGVITSFTLANGGSLNDGNYAGPGGGFNNGYEETSSSVIADTDDSLAGFSDRANLGAILASGLTIAQVEALLDTALYTGDEGTGQFEFDFFDFFIRGDMNGDGALTNGDIAPFVQALTDRAGYDAAFPNIDADIVGDFTGEQAFTNGDIAGFVAALTGGGPGNVPEPTSLALLGLGGLLVARRRR